MKRSLIFLLTLTFPALSPAQVFEPTPAPAAGPAAGTAGPGTAASPDPARAILGNEMPMLDPGSEMATWDGKSWNITNNRLLRARFEKYLAAPEADGAEDKAYRDTMAGVTQALSPAQKGGPDVPKSVGLLVKAANFPIDARLCDSLAQAIYGVVLYKKNERLLAATNKALEQERKNQSWNFEIAGEAAQRRKEQAAERARSAKNGQAAPASTEAEVSEFTRSGGYVKKIVEIDASKIANATKLAAGELRAKVEFQALIVQFFLQRRFEHCIIGCRMYRCLFDDGDTELKLKEGSDVERMFTRTTGTTPTVSALDALSNEAIRDVDEGVQSFEYLVAKNDLESASKRLSEAFIAGEYLPRIRTLPRAKKEQVLSFVRDSNQLISAIEVKDYTLAEELVEKMRREAKDFDFSKPRAAVETARAASALHIMNARSAAIAKDSKTVGEEIKQAALIWPTNPDLKEFAAQISTYGDMNSRILNDLDNLIAQKNFREIFREQIKYSGAVLGKPEYEAKLKAVVEKVGAVEKVILTADEMVKSGDNEGAWERLEEISADFPDDNDVNQRRASLAGRIPEFISTINEARTHEDNGRTGISLSWYLRARQIYPHSIMARAGIDRLADRILPESRTAAPADIPYPGTTPATPVSAPVNPLENPGE